MVVEITDENYEEIVLNNAQPAVLDFWAQWCGPCRAVSKSIDEMAEEYGGDVIIGKVDVDSNPKLSLKFGVRSMPTILYMKKGEVIDKQVGSTSKTRLEEKLKAIM